MKIHLLRHTRPDIPEGICYGQSDVDVLPSFREEREKVIQNLEGINIDLVFSSPLQRCLKLARTIVSNPDDVLVDERLKELHFGKWEKEAWSEIEQTAYAGKWFDNFINVPAPDGESFEMLMRRVQDFIKDLQKRNQCKECLIVCHKGVIIAFKSIVDQEVISKELFKLEIGFGEVLSLEIEPNI